MRGVKNFSDIERSECCSEGKAATQWVVLLGTQLRCCVKRRNDEAKNTRES